MKKLPIILIFVGLFSFVYSLDEEKHQTSFDLESVVDHKHLDDKLKSLNKIYAQIISMTNGLNPRELSAESANKKKADISSMLKKATRLESNPKVNDYLISLSEDIVNDDFTSSYSKWLDLEDEKINLVLRFHKKQKKYKAFVIFHLPNYTQIANKFLSLAERIKTSTISKFTSSLAVAEISDQFVVANLLNATESGQFLLLHPPAAEDLNKSTRKIIVFRNIAKDFFDRILVPVSSNILDVSLIKYVRFKSYFSHLLLHQIAHYLGPYFVQSKTEQPTMVSKKIKNLFTCIEEIKADSVAICAVPVLKEEKISFLSGERKSYTTYVTYLIEKIRSESDDSKKKPFLIELNYLFKNDGLIFNLDTDSILIDFEKFKKAVNKMLGMVINIEQNGRYGNAKQFINEYAVLTPELKRIIKKIESVPKQ